jgi:hypothetical protein
MQSQQLREDLLILVIPINNAALLNLAILVQAIPRFDEGKHTVLLP